MADNSHYEIFKQCQEDFHQLEGINKGIVTFYPMCLFLNNYKLQIREDFIVLQETEIQGLTQISEFTSTLNMMVP